MGVGAVLRESQVGVELRIAGIDALVVFGAVLLLDRLAALLADLEVGLGAELLLDLRAADLADLGEEVRSALIGDGLAALLPNGP